MFNPRSSVRAAIIHNSQADFSAALAIVATPAPEQMVLARAYLGNAKTSHIMVNGRRSRATKIYTAADCRALIARAKKIAASGRWFHQASDGMVMACSLSSAGGKTGFFPAFGA